MNKSIVFVIMRTLLSSQIIIKVRQKNRRKEKIQISRGQDKMEMVHNPR